MRNFSLEEQIPPALHQKCLPWRKCCGSCKAPSGRNWSIPCWIWSSCLSVHNWIHICRDWLASPGKQTKQSISVNGHSFVCTFNPMWIVWVPKTSTRTQDKTKAQRSDMISTINEARIENTFYGLVFIGVAFIIYLFHQRCPRNDKGRLLKQH